jgi:hypothetical protein
VIHSAWFKLKQLQEKIYTLVGNFGYFSGINGALQKKRYPNYEVDTNIIANKGSGARS